MGTTKKANKWAVLAAACGGLFMIMLQSNVINIAVSRIQIDLKADLATVSWVTAGYLLVFTMLLITLGRLGDMIGRRKIFLAGLAVYVAGSLFSGVMAPLGVGWLILGAVIQGIGGAAMMPATQSLIAANFEEKERGMALGIWGAISGLAVAIGPTLGGVLTEYGMGAALNGFFGISQGWRYIYFLNVLLGAAVFVYGMVVLPESRDETIEKGIDVLGIVLSALAVFFLVFGINKGPSLGWWAKKANLAIGPLSLGLPGISLVPVFLAAAVVFLALFILWEKRAGKKALVDMAFFANRDFSAGSLTACILSFSMMGTTFLVPVFLQGVLKFSAISAGLALLPMAVAVIIASPLAGALADRYGSKWPVVIGMAILGAGSFYLANFTLGTKFVSLILPFFVVGFGIGLAMSPITAAALRKIETAKVGGASGMLSTIRQLGSVLGIAILVTSFSGLLIANAPANIAKIDDSILNQGIKTTIIEGIKNSNGSMNQGASEDMLKFYAPAKRKKVEAAMSQAMGQSMTDAINVTFRYAAGVALAGCLSALLLSGKKKKKEAEGAE
jgi:EmrB/QacA subfamily drug resistance transporter